MDDRRAQAGYYCRRRISIRDFRSASLTRQDHATIRGTRLGVGYGLAAYFFWGFFPLFFKQVAHIPPLEVLSHRIVWSLGTLLILLAARGGWKNLRSALATGRTLATLTVTTLLISTNWFVFILAVDHGQVLQSSFGYFINPLVSVLLGVMVLGERLRRLQVVSVALAVCGALFLTLHLGTLPWIPLVLAVTFGLYGLLRKMAPVDALTGLAVETLLLFPVASGYLITLGRSGRGAFPSPDVQDMLLLPLSGVITAIPLLWFAASAKRLRLATVGFMQYITPTIHFLLAVLAFGEPLTPNHIASFTCIWTGLALYSFDVGRRHRA